MCKFVLNSRMKCWYGQCQTGSLWTKLCGARPRPASQYHVRSTLQWDIMQRRVVILYQCFGTTYQSHLQG